MLTRKELAKRYRISAGHLDHLVIRHKVPVLRFGRRVVFDQAAIDALEAACRSKSSPVGIPEHYGLPALSGRPARQPGTAFADALALMTFAKRERKPRR